MSTRIAFDLDGTLVDSVPDIHAAAAAALAAEGLPDLGLERVRSFVGNGVPVLVSRLMAASGLPEDAACHARMERAVLERFNAVPVEKSTVYPGVREALDALRDAGHGLAVCTNKPEAPTRAILDAFGLSDLFDTVIGGDTLTVRKPDPAPLMASLGDNGPFLFVGDSEVDAGTAEAAGVPFLLFTEGYRKTPVADLTHVAAFSHFAELPGLVNQVLSRGS